MSPPAEPDLRSITHMPGFSCGAFGPLALSAWNAAPTIEHAHAAAALLASVARTEPKVLVAAVLGPSTPPPDGAVRDVLTAQITQLGAKIVAVANVVEGHGFRAATIRAVLTGMVLVIRPSYPQRACATIGEAAGFLSERSDGRLTPTSITRALETLRAGDK